MSADNGKIRRSFMQSGSRRAGTALVILLTAGAGAEAEHPRPASQSEPVFPDRIKLISPDVDEWDFFGSEIDGGWPTWLVTEPGDDTGALDGGAAYVFEVDADGTLHYSTLLPSDVALNDNVGEAGSLDGDIAILAGADVDVFTGAAWVFERVSPGNWQETAKLTASDGETRDAFGRSLAVHGEVAFIGATGGSSPLVAGSVYRFERLASGEWVEQERLFPSDSALGDWFGWTVEFDGELLAVGATQSSELPGSVYVFSRDTTGQWAEEAKLASPDSFFHNKFGDAISIDRNRLAVGAPWEGDGVVYVFEKPTVADWVQTAKLTPPDDVEPDDFGGEVLLRGNLLAASAHRSDNLAGLVFLMQLQLDGSWVIREEIDGGFRDGLGSAFAIGPRELWVGASGLTVQGNQNAGAIWVYVRP